MAPVTAEDVVFTFETLVSKGDPMYRNYYADVDKVVAEDKLRVRFDFKHAGNRELPLILGQIAILPKHWWSRPRLFQDRHGNSGGQRPYRIAKGRSGTLHQLRASQGLVGQGPSGLPRTLQLRHHHHRLLSRHVGRPGSLQGRPVRRQPRNIRRRTGPPATKSPALRDGRFIKASIHNHNPVGMRGFFNIRRPVFQDRRVRQTISLLFDFEWSNKQLFFSSYKRTNSYFENSGDGRPPVAQRSRAKILEPLRGKIPDEASTRSSQNPSMTAAG